MADRVDPNNGQPSSSPSPGFAGAIIDLMHHLTGVIDPARTVKQYAGKQDSTINREETGEPDPNSLGSQMGGQ